MAAAFIEVNLTKYCSVDTRDVCNALKEKFPQAIVYANRRANIDYSKIKISDERIDYEAVLNVLHDVYLNQEEEEGESEDEI